MVKEIENIQEKLNWHWRNSMRVVRFFSFDARSALPIPVLLVYARWSTITILVLFLVFFKILEAKGLTFPAAIRNMRSWILGTDRPGFLAARHKKFIDYG